MSRKIIIAILIILNVTFVYLMIMGTIFSYGLIVAELGTDRGLEVANDTTNDILTKVAVLSLSILLINYYCIKKALSGKAPFITSFLITVAAIIVFIPFHLSARQSFLDYQNGTTQLRHYLAGYTIISAQIITGKDTINVQQLDNFIRDIGLAKYKKGPFKYIKTMKLIFNRIDGNKDSIYTNGEMFGAYKGKYFLSNRNMIDKYLAE